LLKTGKPRKGAMQLATIIIIVAVLLLVILIIVRSSGGLNEMWKKVSSVAGGVFGTSGVSGSGSSSRSSSNYCPQCVPIRGLPIKENIGGTIDPGMLDKLEKLDAELKVKNVSWRITEAFPPTYTHKSACHSQGTCIDANIISTGNPEHIKVFFESAKNAGLRAEYEVKTDADKNALTAQNVGGTVRTVKEITAPHFSVYNS
jgi:hypothetical protein